MYNECNGRGVQYLHNLLRFISLIAQITLVKYTHILIIYYICLSMCSRYWLTLEKFVKCITFIYTPHPPPVAHALPCTSENVSCSLMHLITRIILIRVNILITNAFWQSLSLDNLYHLTSILICIPFSLVKYSHL